MTINSVDITLTPDQVAEFLTAAPEAAAAAGLEYVPRLGHPFDWRHGDDSEWNIGPYFIVNNEATAGSAYLSEIGKNTGSMIWVHAPTGELGGAPDVPSGDNQYRPHTPT